MFSGLYVHSVDSKGRIVIPAKFRSRLGERFVITCGLNGCLCVFPEAVWPDFRRKLTPRSILNSRELALERYFLGSAVECSPDQQGRVAVPRTLLDRAGIKDEICIVGLTDRLEIWSKQAWDEFNNALTDDVIRQLWEEAEA